MNKKLLALTICFTLVLTTILTGCASSLPKNETLQSALEKGGYSVVFEDNFNGDKVDTTKWIVGYPTPDRRAGYYTNDNVFVSDGNLTIRTEYKNDGEYGSGWYTGWLESADVYSTKYGENKNKTDDFVGFSAKYGYYEVRCKAPKTQGIWSAFWLMPDTSKGAKGMTKNDVLGTGSDGVEIDVMESFGYKNPNNKSIVQHVLHADGYNKTIKSVHSKPYNVGDMYDEFHTYGVMWTETEYIFYIDDKETWRTKDKVKGTELGVSNVDEYLLLTIEVAGYRKDGVMYEGKEVKPNGKVVNHWAGNPDKNDKSKNYDFIVDYVKVYQQAK